MKNYYKSPLTPISTVFLVDSCGEHSISPSDVDVNHIGEKAYGLACLPKSWTPAWFILSSECFRDYSGAKTESEKSEILSAWNERCVKIIESSDLAASENLIVRSSGVNETLQDRGKFYSKTGKRENLKATLKDCLEENLKDPDSKGQEINFVIQSHISPKEKGHLSNERRCSKEQRDWLGEIERSSYSEPFKVNYRRWRTDIEISSASMNPIPCSLSINLQKSLMTVAAWAQNINSRLHFEWVWNGSYIYLVQVEKEISTGDFSPDDTSSIAIAQEVKDLKVFREIDKNDAKKYRKIKNVFIYLELNLPTAPIYILDDIETLREISDGTIPESLKGDIEKLTGTSLIIRTDISSEDQALLQMLPRSEELRCTKSAIEWLKKHAKSLLADPKIPDEKIAFICHNFIPSESAAFSFSSPGERKVQIESLWGIPEGLYYNSHDKFVVDTLNRELDRLPTKIQKYKISKKIQFKNYCVAPDQNGNWRMQEIKPPFDWRSSIRKDEWLQYIAFYSRKIAEYEDKPTSIMWFVGLSGQNKHPELIPWFHEECHTVNPHNSTRFQKKTPQDKVFDVRYEEDINELIKNLESESSTITHIRVKPVEERLLREKATLQRIGKIAKESDKVILLEGATLSHAYYQLIQVGALVQAEAWFEEDNEVKEFHKLVRDRIPSRISEGGERVDISTLSGDSLMRALKDKLVEEAIEVLDSKNYESLLEELADVQEVIKAIVTKIDSSIDEVNRIQESKHRKLGGFDEGLVLHGTSNPSIQNSSNQNLSLELDLSPAMDTGIQVTNQTANRPSSSWKDKRRSGNSEELLVNFVVPILEDSWAIDSQELYDPNGRRGVSKARLKGKRTSGNLRIELTLYSTGPQLDLFREDDPSG